MFAGAQVLGGGFAVLGLVHAGHGDSQTDELGGLPAGEPIHRLEEPKRVRVHHEPIQLRRLGRRFGRAEHARVVGFADQVGDARVELFRDPDQHAGRNAVSSTLVLLDLLKGQVQVLAENALRDVQFPAAHADARADRDVDGVGRLAARGRDFRRTPIKGHVALH